MFRSLTVLVTLSAVLSAGAVADPITVNRSVAVRTGDLNLQRERDARLMLQRLEAAADRACGGRPTLQGLHPAQMQILKDYERCRDTALTRAVAAVKSPVLDRVFAGSPRGGSRLAGR